MSDELPDYVLNMNAVLSDTNCQWINGKAPDYSKVNELYSNERTKVHEKGSLEDIVTNLVKNWEKEVSHKVNPIECRTIDCQTYKFSTNGGKWYSAQEMAKIGTYNALIGNCHYYSSSQMEDQFHQSHHIFRNCLTQGFAWECIEVYSPPPKVAFKWRHWGKMTGSLHCPMKNGQMISADANNKIIEIFGVTVAVVNEKYQITQLETFFNPNDMFEKMMG